MTYQLTIDYTIGPWGYSKQYVRNLLSGYKGKHVDVKISSLGGDLDHALDIRQQFLDHGDVTVYLSGFVASAATVIAMGAKRIVMSKYAMFLVHKCSNFIDAWGTYNADEMQQLITTLEANKKENDKIDVVLANMYASRCNKKVPDILAILKEGRWLNADEALGYGFVDEIAEPEGERKLNLTPDLSRKFNALGLSTAGLENATASPDQTRKGLLDKIVGSIFPAKKAAEEKSGNPTITPVNTPKMETKKFSAVDRLLKLDVGLTADADGYVSVKAGEMEKINLRIESLEKDVAGKDDDLKKNREKITQLEDQVKNLKNAPGDDTNDIEDGGADYPAFTAMDLFNSVKNCI